MGIETNQGTLDERLADMLAKALDRLEREGDDSAEEGEYDAFELKLAARFIKDAALGRWHHLAGIAEHVHRRASEMSHASFEAYERSQEPTPWSERPFLNATEVGQALRPGMSPVVVKDALAQLGFLKKGDRSWVPTEAAVASGLGVVREDTVGETYILWRPGIVDYLKNEIARRADSKDPIVLYWVSPWGIGNAFRKQLSAASVNKMLEEMGLQRKSEDGGWQACGEGQMLSRAKSWLDGKQRPAAVEWKPDVVHVLARHFRLPLAGHIQPAPEQLPARG